MMREFSSLLMVLLCAGSAHGENSIMGMIHTHRVEKLLAEKRLSTTKDFPAPTQVTQNTILEETEDDPETGLTHTKGRKGHQALPDITMVLSELSRPEKFLKSDQNGMLVGKKEILRKDWCRTEPIVQKLREEGCTPKNVINRFCYGQCNSFFIPKNLSIRRGKRKRIEESSEAFRSCGVCKPKKMVWVQVTLHCPGMDPPLRRRRVQKVKHCQCLAENIV